MVPFPFHPPPPPPDLGLATSNPTPSHSNLTRTILTITFLLLFVLLSILAIHLLLRFLSRRRRNRVSHSPSPNPLLASLPLVSLPASSSKSPLDCAVCLSPFLPSDALRLLPACRHAFHASCVDVWLSSTPSCPLCRAPVEIGSQRSDSVRLELGSVSRRLVTSGRSTSGRSYSIGSELEYVVDDEVEIEAVVAAVAAHVRRESEGKEEEVGGSGRGWLREYVDRLASSASSSFRCSGRWSRRSDAGVVAGGSWDLEGNAELAPYFSFYRWLVGV